MIYRLFSLHYPPLRWVALSQTKRNNMVEIQCDTCKYSIIQHKTDEFDNHFLDMDADLFCELHKQEVKDEHYCEKWSMDENISHDTIDKSMFARVY